MIAAPFIVFFVLLFGVLWYYKRKPVKEEVVYLPIRTNISNRTKKDIKRKVEASKRPYYVVKIGKGRKATILYKSIPQKYPYK